jgi:hypothetical protein
MVAPQQRGSARGSAKHRPGFHVLVLAIGFVVGGYLTVAARTWMPAGAVKEFLTTGVTFSVGPLPVNLGILSFVLGHIAIDFAFLSLVGILVAYLIARSLF